MKSKQQNDLNFKGKLIFFFLSLILILGISNYFPWDRIKNAEPVDNPNNCHYYFSMQYLLSNYPLLAADKANIRLIRERLNKFQTDIASPAKINIPYRKKYDALLKMFKLGSITNHTYDSDILSIAKKSSNLIDDYYLDKNLFCINSQYDWDVRPIHTRMLRYNLSGLYQHIPDKFDTILSAISDDWLTGPAPGFFINNQTTTLDTRFMTAIPMLTALYVLPKYDFLKVGEYSSTAPWNYFRADSFIDKLERKVLDIGGIDVFTVKKAELGNKKIAGTAILSANINAAYHNHFESFINLQSYGMAYLANHIDDKNPMEVNKSESFIKDYFSHHNDPKGFVKTINSLYSQLLLLKNKHDIILETTAPTSPGMNNPAEPSGEVKINGIVGERGYFATNCARDQCIFVLNLAKSSGWHAYVNDKSVDIMRANFAFMAIAVPHGLSHVWFIYEPISHLLGDFISLFSLIIIALITITRKNGH